MVHPDSRRVSRVPRYSGITPVARSFRLRGCHPLRPDFPICSAIIFQILCVTLQPLCTCTKVWASPRSLAATQGIIFIFSSWGYLDGSVHPVRLRNLCIQLRITLMCWVSPFGQPRINARLAAPRGFSQPSTSFIASCRQGIHQIHLNYYHAVYLVQDQSWIISNYPFS